MGLNDIMNMEGSVYVKCDLCGHDDPVLFLEKNGYNIVKCRNCSMVYVNPRLKSEDLCNLYNENVISPYHYYLETKDDDEKTFEKRLDIIEKYAKSGKLLDVGCSIGTFSVVAKNRGWEVYGVDINAQSVNYCLKKLNLDVKAGDFEKLDFPEDFFDVIIMNDFLEHVGSPTRALKKANQFLKKGGVIFIVTPKIDSFMARISKENWLHLKPNEHIFYFSSKTMGDILKRTGFETISIRPIGRYRSLHTILSKTKTYSGVINKLFGRMMDNQNLKQVSIRLNIRDEMAAIAKKV
jgi:2-polyprenyl-3-methyl-5-hydroxy-6-metoxy-1,4-benzoquinol methylase